MEAGGRFVRLQHRPLGKTNKPVNYPFGLRGITEKPLGENPSGEFLWLEQTVPDRVANQARCFMYIEFVHQPAPMRFSGLGADSKE